MRSKAKRVIFAVIIINLILLFVAYWQTLNVYFLSEDYAWWGYVQGKNLGELIKSILPSSWQALSPSSWYRPLVVFSYWLNVNFCWLRPACFHLTNYLFHLVNFFLAVGVGYFLAKKNWFVGFLCLLERFFIPW